MKAKTHSGSKKRVKVTGSGKFRTAKIGKRHLLQNKSSKSKGRGKYGAATHVANERKMKWGHKVSGLRTPSKKSTSSPKKSAPAEQKVGEEKVVKKTTAKKATKKTPSKK